MSRMWRRGTSSTDRYIEASAAQIKSQFAAAVRKGLAEAAKLGVERTCTVHCSFNVTRSAQTARRRSRDRTPLQVWSTVRRAGADPKRKLQVLAKKFEQSPAPLAVRCGAHDGVEKMLVEAIVVSNDGERAVLAIEAPKKSSPKKTPENFGKD
jgi:hypothetical protein